MSCYGAIRTEYKDIVPWNESMASNPKRAKISLALELEIENGRIPIEDAINVYVRGGDPEILLEGKAVNEPEPAPAVPDDDATPDEEQDLELKGFIVPAGKDILHADLTTLTFVELRNRAKAVGASYNGRMNKEELIAAITAKESPATPAEGKE